MTLLRRTSRLTTSLTTALLVAACGGSDDLMAPGAALERFVGDWDASEFVIVSSADPVVGSDLIEGGGAFSLNVQPSGQYTAILDFPDFPGIAPAEVGELDVSENASTVTFRPQGGPSATSSFQFNGTDQLVLEGPTEFDFDLDGFPEDAMSRITLNRS